MTAIEVDRSLRFRFSAAWSVLHWESSSERQTRKIAGRKNVDVAATGPAALLVEAKDDRIKDATSRVGRVKAIKTGQFPDHVAEKFRHSVEDLLEVAAQSAGSTFCRSFATMWNRERRQLLLWWELPPDPPQGRGAPDDRWKAYLSALQNQLKQRVRDLTPRVRIANQRFGANVIGGMTVEDVAGGIGERRKSIR